MHLYILYWQWNRVVSVEPAIQYLTAKEPHAVLATFTLSWAANTSDQNVVFVWDIENKTQYKLA